MVRGASDESIGTSFLIFPTSVLMLELVIVVVAVVVGAIISVRLTNLACEHLTEEGKKGWISRLPDESAFTEEGKPLRRRAMRFMNGYLLVIVLFFVIASHMLSCHKT